MTKRCALMYAAVLSGVAAGALQAQVKVYAGTLTLPASEEGVPNPNPPFDAYSTGRYNYPYTLRDNVLDQRQPHTFRAIYLENEYLKCSVLPDVGGHIYTCVDKINGVPMFYANPSIKEAQIGMRGGWAAFGQEFNFPVSHSWTTISPVDFAWRQLPDGSASVTISNVDRVYGMQWNVELVLRPGTTLLEEHVTLTNRDDVRHRFYWWSNTGIQVWDDSRIEYPMRFSAAHGFADVDRWPVDSSGVDLSVLRNQTAGVVSRFVHGSREPYMGVWNPHTNAGVVHYAPYAELPAKKIWSWGVDADGLDWRRQLSDNNSAYVEVQGGLFRNQETYAFLQPRESVRFHEYWMPVRGLGGLSRANLAGAVLLGRNGSSLTAALNVNRQFPGATVRVLRGTEVVRSFQGDLSPEHTWQQSIALPDAAAHYTFEVRDKSGAVVLTQTEGKYDWTPESEIKLGKQDNPVAPPAAQRSEDDWLQAGHDQELNGMLLVAAGTYRDGLARFPNSQSLSIAAGRLAVAMLHYDDAVRLLRAAAARDTPHPAVAYYLGLAYDGLGDEAHARTAYETSARLPDLRAAAALRLGEMEARKGDWADAEKWLREALLAAPDDLRSAEELGAVLRSGGHAEEAKALEATWSGRFPASYFLHEEMGTPDLLHLSADPERVLNVAAEYMRLGMYRQALTVLSRTYAAVPAEQREPGSVLPQNNPLVGYYRAYCLKQMGQPDAGALDAAAAESVRYVFPSGRASDAVLRAAVEERPNDATALDLLGTLRFAMGSTKEAEALWDRAGSAAHSSLPALDANRGLAALHVDHDPARAAAMFRHGIESDPTNQTNYEGLDQAFSQLHRPPAEFLAAMAHYPDPATMTPALVYELALHQAEAGHMEEAEALLRDRTFTREENGTNVREVWVAIGLMKIRALAAEGKCGEMQAAVEELGKPKAGFAFTNDGMEPFVASARTQLEIGMAERQCHQDGNATAALERAANNSSQGEIAWAYLAAKQLPGFDAAAWRPRLQAALEVAQRSAESYPQNMLRVGLLERALGDEAAADAALQKVFLLPDRHASYHLARMAERDRLATPPK